MADVLWVKIETTKANDDIWSFKGKMERAVFERIIKNRMKSGYFRLDKVYWISSRYDDYGNEKGETLYQYGRENLQALRGDLYLKVEHVVSIAPIDGDMELARFNQPDKKTLCVVSPIRSS